MENKTKKVKTYCLLFDFLGGNGHLIMQHRFYFIQTKKKKELCG